MLNTINFAKSQHEILRILGYTKNLKYYIVNITYFNTIFFSIFVIFVHCSIQSISYWNFVLFVVSNILSLQNFILKFSKISKYEFQIFKTKGLHVARSIKFKFPRIAALSSTAAHCVARAEDVEDTAR
jgi:hypothetical protein